MTKPSVASNDRDPGGDIEPTEEVGSEGGGAGDVQVGIPATPGRGREADEIWQPTNSPHDEDQ